MREHVVAEPLRNSCRPAQCPTISQACGRSTAIWSVTLRALDGPMPMLISGNAADSPARRDERQASAARASGATPRRATRQARALRVIALPGATKASRPISPDARRCSAQLHEGNRHRAGNSWRSRSSGNARDRCRCSDRAGAASNRPARARNRDRGSGASAGSSKGAVGDRIVHGGKIGRIGTPSQRIA